MNPETEQIMISRDVTFLDKSFGDWENVKDPAIVQFATSMIDTFDEYYEVDVTNLNLPDHVPDDDEPIIDDDDTFQCEDFQIPVPSIHKHVNNVSDSKDSNDKDSEDDSLQGSAIHLDLEGHDAVDDENNINEQPRPETTVNTKKNWRHLSILKL